MMMMPACVVPARANSHDKAAKYNNYYFGGGGSQLQRGSNDVPSVEGEGGIAGNVYRMVEDIDNKSIRSHGKCSAFSEGDIYSTTSQA